MMSRRAIGTTSCPTGDAVSASASKPSAAFDWAQVRWRVPRMGRPLRCCYRPCGATLHPNAPRLIVCDNGGYGAEFCEACLDRFWHTRPPERPVH